MQAQALEAQHLNDRQAIEKDQRIHTTTNLIYHVCLWYYLDIRLQSTDSKNLLKEFRDKQRGELKDFTKQQAVALKNDKSNKKLKAQQKEDKDKFVQKQATDDKSFQEKLLKQKQEDDEMLARHQQDQVCGELKPKQSCISMLINMCR